MLKNTKMFLLGFLCCTILFTLTVTVFGAPLEKAITAVYNDIKIYIDGVLISPKDANGNAIEPFVYNGTTYLPVRAVGEAFGKSVEWDGATQSVYIGKKTYEPTTKTRLTDLTPTATKFGYNGTNKPSITNLTSLDTDNHGNSYSFGYMHKLPYAARWIYNDYAVDKKYKTISGTAALSNSTKSTDATVVMVVYGLLANGDVKKIYTSPIIKSGVRPVNFNVDISEWMDISIYVIACDKDGNIETANGGSFSVSNQIEVILGDVCLE